MKIVILALIIFAGIMAFALSGKYVTNAQSVSELHPMFSYEDATFVAEH